MTKLNRDDTLAAGGIHNMRRVTALCETFVGRSLELAALGRALESAAAGRTVVVAIVGDVGIGKSRLAGEFAERSANEIGRFATGHCVEHLCAPYLPLSEAARHLGLDTQALFPEDPERGSMGRGPQREKQLHRVTQLASALSTPKDAKPTLLLIEDIHWADAATLGFIDHITTAGSVGAALILLTARSEELERGGRVARLLAKLRGVGVEVLRLAPLENSEMSIFVRGIASGGLTRPTVERIKALSEGNPLIAEELTRSTLDDDVKTPALDGASIRRTVLDRLYKLSEADQEILTCAAVIGRFFDANELALLARRKLDHTFSALRRGRLVQLVKELPEHSAYGMMFRHSAFAEIIYHELLRPEARELHARYVAMLEQSSGDARLAELAYHSYAARDLERALLYNQLAGDSAMAMNAFEDAGRYYDTALDIAGDDLLLRARICEKRAYAWWAAGVSDRTEEYLADALAAYKKLGDTNKIVEMHLYQSRQAWNDGASSSGLQHALLAAELTVDADPAQHIFAMTMAASHAVHLGQADRALDLLRATPSLDIETPAVSARKLDTESHVALRRGNAESARDLSERAREAAHRSGDTDTIVRICSNAADLEASLGSVETSISLWRMAFEAAKSGGFVGRQMYACLGYARALIDIGKLDAARHLYESAIPAGVLNMSVAIQLGAVDSLLRSLTSLETPQLVDERAVFDVAVSTNESVRIGQLGSALAFASLLRGDILVTTRTLEQAVEALPGPHFAEDLLLLGAMFGSTPRVRSLAYDHIAVLSENPEHKLALLANDVLNARSQKGPSRRLAIRGVIRDAYRLGRPLYIAAIAIAEKNDSLLQDVLSRIGAAPRTTQLTVREPLRQALTPREREVASMLAQEASNRAIADHFGISERTVEHHVESILSRLGVRSRWLVTPSLLAEAVTASR